MNLKHSIKLAASAALLLFAGLTGTAYAEAPVMNGVAYVLLSKDLDNHGVFRMNDYSTGKPFKDDGMKLFNLNTMTGKVSGLAVNQQKQIFLLSSKTAGSWEDAPVGWLPVGMSFEADSPIYLKVVKPTQDGISQYIRPGTPHMSSATEGSHWKRNFSIAGKTYTYAVNFGGPTEVRFLNAKDGAIGTPIWDGTFSATSGLAHESDPNKVIIPSHFAGVAYYAYGTTHHPQFAGEALDGTIGKNGSMKPLKLWNEGAAGHQNNPNTLFSCIVKRIYKHRKKTLDLYAALDNNPCSSPAEQSAGMLSSLDVDVREAYGKYCGDNCIPGGSIGQNSILTKLSTVTVVTSTKGSRYGFNPQGTRKGPFTADSSINAALRVVLASDLSKTTAYDISTDAEGTNFSNIITNRDYLKGIGVTPANLKVIGVSSDFGNSGGMDFIYGSDADKFVVQDSWWGRGGIAYEYYENTGLIQKLDYVSNDNPVAEPLGVLNGIVDDIGIDGDGYLYVLRTEKLPSDTEMAAAIVEVNSPDKSSYYDSTSGWKRIKVTTSPDGEKVEEIVDVTGSPQPDDFKIVKLKQEIFKTVKRYPQGTGALGAEEDRGKVKAGYDYWVRHAVLQAGGTMQWRTPTFSVSDDVDTPKASKFPGELAVVNLAKIPANYEGTSVHRIIVTQGDKPDIAYNSITDNPSISEHDSLVFKVEGYKPYINGKFQEFKPMGDIVDPTTNTKLYANVKLNTIPNDKGEYRHDENGDNEFCGFPSNMFEAAGRPTSIKWSVDWVEGNSIDDYKVINSLVTAKDGEGELGTFTYKFPHPGNYVIRGSMTYNYFTFPTSNNSRPHQLTANTTTVNLEPFMVKVVAKSLNLNQSPSFVTNISMKPATRKNMPGVAPATKGAGSKIDFIEDNSFSGIEISFDAQFVRDANYTGSVDLNLETYDGIGVWDYRYYAKLYKEIPNLFPALPYKVPANISEIDNEAATAHVYNYNPAGSISDIKSKIKSDVFNPGRAKGGDPEFVHGTDLKNEPDDKDWGFIQWALYLRPNGPYQIATPTTALGADVRHDRGILVAQGSCTDPGVSKTLLSDRKYSVNIVVPAESIKKINTPKDPETYSLNLEIIYPRVSWVTNDLGDGKNEKRFSSMVPLFADEDSLSTNHSAGTNPIHVLGRMKLANGGEPAGNFILNQSWKFSGNQFFNAGGDSIEVLARDVTLPTLVQAPGDNPTPVIQTTGDDVTDVNVGFAAYDNNPHAEFKDFFAAYQTLKNETNVLDNSEDNKIFKPEAKISGSAVKLIPGADDPGFYADNNWTNGASFTTTIKEYGPNGPFQKNQPFENWIGTLNYTVMGSVYDGIGSDARDITHQFYHAKACQDLGMSVADEEKILVDNNLIKAVERIDNDPPSLEIELVSQVDNRRWVFKLDENIHDSGPVPNDVSQLGKCTLSAKCFNLQGGAEISSFNNEEIEGCAGYPSQIGQNSILVTDVFADAVPKFRRASRLLVNVHVFDNTGFRSLSEATLTISDNDGAGARSLMPSNSPAVPLIPSLNLAGVKINDLDKKPRASYAIDMPMKINGEKQVTIELKAKDQDNNERSLVIPVTVVESTFETRVLETKENKN